MFELLLAGGPFMFATLATSIITMAIFIWRVVFLWGKNRSSKYILAQTINYIESASISKALQLCNSDGSSLAKVLRAALMRANRSEKEIRRAVEATALEELPRVKAGTNYLPQLSNLATLFGLVGTIHGLIVSFRGAGSESAATRQAVLSKGIAIAFYNTFFGLIVATMGIIFYLLLMSKMNGTTALMEQSAATVVDRILSMREKARKSA
jgi:biopolymer transport protein ExbB/TolQ